MRIITVSVLLLASIFCHARVGETCDLTERESVVAMVHALTHCYHERSVADDREYIAAIYRDSGGLISDVTTGKRGHDEASIRVKRGGARKLLALWHTHGRHGKARSLFSELDVAVVNQLDVPFFLTDPTGVIWRLDPGARTTRQRVSGSVTRVNGAFGVVVTN